MRRQADPVAAGLIVVLLRLERRPWPAAMRTYAVALLALSIRCEFTSGQAELYRWLANELRPILRGGQLSARTHRLDALADIVCTAWTRLQRWRAGLESSRRPHLVSMLDQAASRQHFGQPPGVKAAAATRSG